MVKNYRGINDDLLRILVLAQERVVEKLQGWKTSRYPNQIQKQYEEDMEKINRLAKVIKRS